ncbi:helix-turn-helix transcriptional regulator, partial [Vibrio owensii]|uniref:helix-turn-helix transcriptional regulator n=1 Tax=Vibrio owensii TaxID=696485 RepID=UPI003AAE176A
MSEQFSSYLQEMRAKHNLTQQQVIDHLLGIDSAFEKLDITTYSRWERGITAPKLAKQLMVVRAFYGDITALLPTPELSSKPQLEFQRAVNNIHYPYAVEERLVPDISSLTSTAPEIMSRIISFTEHYLGLKISKELLSNPNVVVATITDATGHLVAHSLYSFAPTNTPNHLLEPDNSDRSPFTTLEKNNREPVSLCQLSSYTALPSARLAIIMNMLNIMRKHNEIRYFVTNCHNHAMYSLYDAYADFEIL